MAYRLRIYAPTSQYYDSILVMTPGSPTVQATPLGTSAPCYDSYISSGDIRVGPNIKAGQEDTFANQVFQQWVVNLDGNVTIIQTPFIYLDFPTYSKYSNVSIRLEINEPEPPKIYYAQIAFNANGGSGAPATQSISQQNVNPYVEFYIPYTTPKRAGYVFGGWTLNGTTGTVYAQGEKITVYGYNYPPGPTHTLYAYWTQDTSGSMWLHASNRWAKGVPWLYASGRWVKGIPWLCANGIWKRGG